MLKFIYAVINCFEFENRLQYPLEFYRMELLEVSVDCRQTNTRMIIKVV